MSVDDLSCANVIRFICIESNSIQSYRIEEEKRISALFLNWFHLFVFFLFVFDRSFRSLQWIATAGRRRANNVSLKRRDHLPFIRFSFCSFGWSFWSFSVRHSTIFSCRFRRDPQKIFGNKSHRNSSDEWNERRAADDLPWRNLSLHLDVHRHSDHLHSFCSTERTDDRSRLDRNVRTVERPTSQNVGSDRNDGHLNVKRNTSFCVDGF